MYTLYASYSYIHFCLSIRLVNIVEQIQSEKVDSSYIKRS